MLASMLVVAAQQLLAAQDARLATRFGSTVEIWVIGVANMGRARQLFTVGCSETVNHVVYK